MILLEQDLHLDYFNKTETNKGPLSTNVQFIN